MPSDPRDYQLDIRSAQIDAADRTAVERDDAGRKYLGVMFACCKAYQRVYPSADGGRYLARCPRCLRTITFKVGEGGTDQRVFVVE